MDGDSLNALTDKILQGELGMELLSDRLRFLKNLMI